MMAAAISPADHTKDVVGDYHRVCIVDEVKLELFEVVPKARKYTSVLTMAEVADKPLDSGTTICLASSRTR